MSPWTKRWLSRPRRSACSREPPTCAKARPRFSRSARRRLAAPESALASPSPEVSDVQAVGTGVGSIASLSLKAFRNFERLELQVPASGFVLVGENGQGKTNLLES